LNLPDDSLTKEIKLMNEILEIFLEFQCPPDLISYGKSQSAQKAREAGEREREVEGREGEAQVREREEKGKEKEGSEVGNCFLVLLFLFVCLFVEER